ncbi:hypothetical protein PLACP1_08820 [Planifilum fimeticola]
MNWKGSAARGKIGLGPNGLSSQKAMRGIKYRKPRSIQWIPQGEREGGHAGETDRPGID